MKKMLNRKKCKTMFSYLLMSSSPLSYWMLEWSPLSCPAAEQYRRAGLDLGQEILHKMLG